MAARLREAGAVILGKANLSEWANFRSTQSSSGWSAVGGACRNPYVLDRNPCGSSSGSGTAVSANLAAAALGTETDGSIVCPGVGQRAGRHQAHRWPDQPGRGGPHLPHPGHHRPDGPNGGRRRRGAGGADRGGRPRRGHRGQRWQQPHRLRAVPGPRRPGRGPDRGGPPAVDPQPRDGGHLRRRGRQAGRPRGRPGRPGRVPVVRRVQHRLAGVRRAAAGVQDRPGPLPPTPGSVARRPWPTSSPSTTPMPTPS